MNYLLDTNAVVAVRKNQPVLARMHFRSAMAAGATIAISSLVLHELWFGILRSKLRQQNTEWLRAFLSGNIEILPFDENDAMTAAEVRAALQSAGTPIGPYDLLIASQALRRRATLVTANVAEFARVAGLDWQDWTK